MLQFEKPIYKITDSVESNFYGRFELEPLERGFGTTIGNALRRVMLSSLPGSAISSIKIDGVLHEFQTIEGVYEDVTTIILFINYTRGRFGGRHPLCGIGVTSTIVVTSNPAV